MRASRLVEMVLLLQTRGRMTASELSQRLEVSRRTVLRDAEALAAAGVPVVAERGSHGGLRLLDGYRTRLTGLTRNEAEALFLSGVPGAAADLGLAGVLAAAELKVLAALPPDLRTAASRARERFHVDAPGWFRPAEPPAHLPTVAGAVWAERRLEVEYRRSDNAVVRRFLKPLGLVLKAGVWYVVALYRREPYAYRLSRFERVRVLDETFERPDGFDLESFWARYAEQFEVSLYRVPVRLRATKGARVDLERHFRNRVAQHEGDVLTVLFEHLDHADSLLAYGADVEVLDPPELRRSFASMSGELARLYGRS